MTQHLQRTHGASFLIPGCLLAASVWVAPYAAACQDELPAEARVMTGLELYLLYSNKSWRWPDGAGRMESEGRRFVAWSGTGETASWAEGRWIVTDSGRLCMAATWHSRTAAVTNRTCFSHKKHGDTIYQKKEPSGGWYVFFNPGSEEDESVNLVREDLVSAELETLKSRISIVAPET